MDEKNRKFYESDAGRKYCEFKFFDGNPMCVHDFLHAMDELDMERNREINGEMQ